MGLSEWLAGTPLICFVGEAICNDGKAGAELDAPNHGAGQCGVLIRSIGNL